jgi:hypothetical protein
MPVGTHLYLITLVVPSAIFFAASPALAQATSVAKMGVTKLMLSPEAIVPA